MTAAAVTVLARTGAARAITATSGPAGRAPEAASEQQLKAAHSLVKVLSGMRGAAMKVGQTLSAVDLGMVPAEVRPEFQEILSSLQQSAEPVPFAAVRRVIEEDLGRRLSADFADFDPEPIAAASIGQVHRAVLRDGRDVAVKVQYPGIAEAIHADMQNLRLGLRLLSSIAPGIDTDAIATEIRERISEELDYELEASNHRAMARAYRGHPFALVPNVVMPLCRERLIVTEFVDGCRFAVVLDRDSAERDRLGEILVRFYLNGPLRHGLLNGDPHPGNALFLDDGRVAFLDFGFFKRLSSLEVEQLVASTRATRAGDAAELLRVVSALGALPADQRLAQPFLEHYEAIFGWLLAEGPLMIESAQTAAMMRRYNEMRRSAEFARLELPAEHFVLMRAVMLLLGLLGQLRATGSWLDISREWLYGEGPVTELGRLEAGFFGPRAALGIGAPA